MLQIPFIAFRATIVTEEILLGVKQSLRSNFERKHESKEIAECARTSL